MSGYTEIALLQYELEKIHAELAEKDADVEKLKRLNSSYSSLTKAKEGQLTALRNRLYELRGADKTLDSEREANAILTEELAALKAELREICAAIDDPACDLTLTAVECIKKLKAENESLKRDAERYQWLRDVMSKSIGGGVEVNDAALVYETSEPGEEVRVYWYPNTPIGFYDSKGSTLDEAIDAAMIAGEQG